MAITIGEILAVLKLRDDLSPALKIASYNLKQTGKAWQEAGQKMQSTGQALIPLSAGIAAAGAAAFKFGKDFEVTMTRVGVITEIGVENVEEMTRAVLELSGRTAQAPQELAEGLMVVASTGMKGKQALDILEQSARASAAGLGETKDIARAVTAAMTAYGAETLSATEAMDKLFVAVRAGGAEATEFAGTLGRVVGIAAQVGVSFDEVLASVATFTRLGVRADEAVTALRGTLSVLLNPSKGAEDQLNKLGTSMEELRATVQDRGLMVALTGLIERANGSEEAIAEVIPNVRALAGVLGTAGRQSEAYANTLREIGDATGTLDKAFGAVSETVEMQWNQALADAERLAVRVFGVFRDQFKATVTGFSSVVSAADDLVTGLDRLGPVAKTVLFGAGVGLAVAAPGLIAVGVAIRGIGFAMTGLATGIGAATPVIAGFWRALIGPVGLAVTGIGLLVSETERLYGLWKKGPALAGSSVGLILGGMTGSPGAMAAGLGMRGFDETLKQMSLGAVATGVPIEALGESIGKLSPPLRKAAADTSAFDDALKSLREKQADALIQARAWIEFTKGRAMTDLPTAIRQGLFEALQEVVDQFGSLKAAEMGAFDQLYKDVGRASGNIRTLADQIGALGGFSLEKGSLFDQMAAASVGKEFRPDTLVGAGPFGSVMVQSPITDLAKSWFDQLAEVRKQSSNTLTFVAEQAESFWDKVAKPKKSFAQALFGSTKEFAGGLSQTLMDAVTGGGDIGQAAGTFIGKSLAENIGKTIGGTLGAILGPIGTLAGSLLGKGLSKAGGFLKDLFGFGTKGRDMVKEFAKSFGGFDALREKLGELGDEGERLWVRLTQGTGRNDAKAAQAAIDAITKAFERQQETIKREASLIEQLGEATKQFGGVAPKALQPFIAELLKSNKLTETMRQALVALAGDPSWQTLQQTAEKYGIALEALGPQFQQAKLSEIALEYARDFQMLVDAGGDVNGILEGMKDEIQEVVTNALKFGLDVPMAMRPLIEKLIEMGGLVDENGNALKDMDRINFTGTLEDGLKGIQSVLEQIRDFLLYGFKEPAQRAADDIRSAFEAIDIRIPVTVDPGDMDLPSKAIGVGDELLGFAQGTGGRFARFDPGGQMIVAHGDEAIVPRGEGDSLAAEIAAALGPMMGGGGDNYVFTINVETVDAAGLEQAVERRILPQITSTISGNKRASRTKMRAALGVE